MSTSRSKPLVILITREQMNAIREIQEEERARSGIGLCPGIHEVGRGLIDIALAVRERQPEGKN